MFIMILIGKFENYVIINTSNIKNQKFPQITKLNERVFRGNAKQILKTLKENKKNILGEFVILVEKYLEEE